MRNVSRYRRRGLFAFDHSFRKPVKPLIAGLPVQGATPFFGIDFQFLPRDNERAAKEIVDQIQRHLAAENQNAETFPGKRDQINRIFAIRPEDFSYLCRVSAIGQGKNTTQRRGERRICTAAKITPAVTAMALIKLAMLEMFTSRSGGSIMWVGRDSNPEPTPTGSGLLNSCAA